MAEERRPIGEFLIPELISQALEEATWNAIEEHRLHGWPMVSWEAGRVVRVPSDRLPRRPGDSKPGSP